MNYNNNDDILKRINNIDYKNKENFAENISLEGTSINDLTTKKMDYDIKKPEPIHKEFIQSITKEIMNNLKNNNLSFNDDNNSLMLDENISKDDYSTNSYSSKKSSSNSKSKKKEKFDSLINDKIENFVDEQFPIKGSGKTIMSYVFDDCFGIKDFILLFSIYFILSQDMIKDLFSSYFTSLNPDEDGKVGVKGVILYGLILTIVFMIFKKYLI
jgi:hypothetical protein